MSRIHLATVFDHAPDGVPLNRPIAEMSNCLDAPADWRSVGLARPSGLEDDVPELPEVETLRRELSLTLSGRTICSVRALVPNLFRAGSPEDLIGRQFVRMRRRAKLLIFELTDSFGLLVHSKLAGQFVHQSAEGAILARGGHPIPAFGSPLPHKATRAVFDLDDGSTLFFTDIRRFGYMLAIPIDQIDLHLEQLGLGPEPLTDQFDLTNFAERLHRRTTAPIKSVLLDQSLVAGIGNIYADESLHEAGIHPTTPAGSIDDADIERLHRAIRNVLRRAVDEGVAEIYGNKAAPDRDFPRAHGREGLPCFTCDESIIRIRIGGRSTYFCPACQKQRN